MARSIRLVTIDKDVSSQHHDRGDHDDNAQRHSQRHSQRHYTYIRSTPSGYTYVMCSTLIYSKTPCHAVSVGLNGCYADCGLLLCQLRHATSVRLSLRPQPYRGLLRVTTGRLISPLLCVLFPSLQPGTLVLTICSDCISRVPHRAAGVC